MYFFSPVVASSYTSFQSNLVFVLEYFILQNGTLFIFYIVRKHRRWRRKWSTQIY